MLRLFFAIHVVPTAALRTVLNRLARFEPGVRPVDREAMHVTLRFLGDTPRSRVAELASALDRAAQGAVRSTVTLSGLGRFEADPRGRLRVIFANLEPAEPVAALAAALTGQLERLDPPIPPDPRRSTPHLTLARVRRKPPPDLLQLLDELAAEDLGATPIEAAHLYSSDLTPRGPVHTILHTTTLPGR